MSHPLEGKVVCLSPDIGNWWDVRCYTHYIYRVIRVVNRDAKLPLAHLDIVKKLPGRQGRESIEYECKHGETINVYTKDLVIVDNIKNSEMKMFLDMEGL
jgi:hypothetical protein